MNELYSSKKYDPIAIGKEAEAANSNGDFEAAQMIYQSALLEWQDDVREMADNCDSMQMEQMSHAIASLWLAYANFNRQVKQFKSCQEAYEGAVNDEVVKSMGRIWLDYARYFEERNRYAAAQKVYLRALTGGVGNRGVVTDETDREILWEEFLRMMQERWENPSLTMEKLMTDVAEKIETEALTNMQKAEEEMDSEAPYIVRSSEGPSTVTSADTDVLDDRPAKRAKLTEESPAVPLPELSVADKKATSDYIDSQCALLMQVVQLMPQDLQAAWMASDGNASPSRPEPLFAPSPPKLSDASGKDIIGVNNALHIVQLLLKTSNELGKDLDGTILLNICKSCWAMCAFKEADAAKALADLDKKMNEGLESLETKLVARETVAGAASEAVKQVNQNERNEFIMTCNFHRQQLLDYHAWEFRNLLYTQQQLLTKVNVPYFQGPTIDSMTILCQAKICSVLHSAFVLRGKVGEVAHRALLVKLEERLIKEVSAASNPMEPMMPSALPMIPHGVALIPGGKQPTAMGIGITQPPGQFFAHSSSMPSQQYLGHYNLPPGPIHSKFPPPPPFMPAPAPLMQTAKYGYQQPHNFQTSR